MKCKICGNPSEIFAGATIRGKYQIKYFACSSCGFMQTEEPFWLAEAYAQPINRSDVGYVSRNFAFAKITKSVISLLFDGQARFIDYGGGFGLFAAVLHDLEEQRDERRGDEFAGGRRGKDRDSDELIGRAACVSRDDAAHARDERWHADNRRGESSAEFADLPLVRGHAQQQRA